MIRINPSIASASPLALLDSMQRLGKVQRLHFDIEDGNFVPNITFGLKTVRELLRHAAAPADAHLLVTNPDDYLDDLAACNISAVAVHYEALRYPLVPLTAIRRHRMRAGLALNFNTPAEALAPFAAAVDYVIVMTAEPDGGDQRFYPPMLDKIRRLRGILPPEAEVWADGGIGAAELARVAAAGADTAVVGRAIWAADDPAAAYGILSAAGAGHGGVCDA